MVALAGGGGVETALADAASVGSGWAFAYLRRALDQARLARQTPWAALGRLGQELGVGELSELAASVALAGTEGAKVRASLAAKAASLRTHELAEAETADQAATERMSLPVVLLFAGFLLFLGFPAVEKVLTGLCEQSHQRKEDQPNERTSAVFPELIIIRHLFTVLHGRWQALRADPDAGYSTEAVIVTALLAALALTAVGIIVAKVVSSANNINTNGP